MVLCCNVNDVSVLKLMMWATGVVNVDANRGVFVVYMVCRLRLFFILFLILASSSSSSSYPCVHTKLIWWTFLGEFLRKVLRILEKFLLIFAKLCTHTHTCK